MKTNKNKINWLNFIYIQQKFSFKPIKIALIKVNWPGRGKTQKKKEIKKHVLKIRRKKSEESSKMTNCVRLPCYFHSFVKSNLFLGLFYTWTIFFSCPVCLQRITLHIKSNKKYTESVFPFFTSLFFYTIRITTEKMLKQFAWLFVQRCSSLKLLKPMRIVHIHTSNTGSIQSTSKHRMEVNKINNVTSTTTVHIIWFSRSPVQALCAFFSLNFFISVVLFDGCDTHRTKDKKKQKKYKFDHIFHLFGMIFFKKKFYPSYSTVCVLLIFVYYLIRFCWLHFVQLYHLNAQCSHMRFFSCI